MKENNLENVFKIIVIGDSNVGKTNLISRYCWNKLPKKTILDNFILTNEPTVAIEFCSQDIIINIDSKVCIGKIWDTAGQERFHSITKFYYRGSNGCLLIYDISNKKTFQEISRWVNEIKEMEPDCVILLIGNKSDLHDQRQVNKEEALQFAKDNFLFYMETSAINNINVVEAFEKILEEVYLKFKKNNQMKKKESKNLDFNHLNQNQNQNNTCFNICTK